MKVSRATTGGAFSLAILACLCLGSSAQASELTTAHDAHVRTYQAPLRHPVHSVCGRGSHLEIDRDLFDRVKSRRCIPDWYRYLQY